MKKLTYEFVKEQIEKERKCCYDKNIDLLVIWDNEWVNEKDKCLDDIRSFFK